MQGGVEGYGVDGGVDGGAGEEEADAGIEEVHDAPDVGACLALLVCELEMSSLYTRWKRRGGAQARVPS